MKFSGLFIFPLDYIIITDDYSSCQGAEYKNMNKILSIKKRLKEIRESKEFSRPKVSKETGIPEATLKDWEMNGTLPRLDKAQQLAQLYGVSLDYLACRTDEPINPEVNKETPKDNSKINK